MSEILMTKIPNGYLVPFNEEAVNTIQRMKSGAVVKCDVKAMRNSKFFKKFFVLVKLAYEMWEETLTPQEYKGVPVQPEFNRFRKDITIMAGYCRPVWNAKGELRLEAASLAWANMDEAEFEKLYSATINVILTKVLHNCKLTREQIDASVETILRFS